MLKKRKTKKLLRRDIDNRRDKIDVKKGGRRNEEAGIAAGASGLRIVHLRFD